MVSTREPSARLPMRIDLMSLRAIWCIVSAWCAGLVAGQAFSSALYIILLIAAVSFYLVKKVPWLSRSSILLLVFLLAAIAGDREGIAFNTPRNGFEEGIRRGLNNPHYRPILIARQEPSESEDESDKRAAEIPWASRPVEGMIEAIIFNNRDRMPVEWVSAFRTTGTAHLIAVSGLHIGILVSIVLVLLKSMRLGRLARTIITITGCWIYVLAIGAPPSAVRAAMMTSIGLFVLGMGRNCSHNRILPTAILFILVVKPSMIATVGFQLSVSALLGIGLALRGIDGSHYRTTRARLEILFRISVGAQAGVMPLQIYTFGYYSPLAPIINAAAVPLIGIWLSAAIAAISTGFIWGTLSMIIGAFCEGTGRILLWWIYAWSMLPGIVMPASAAIALIAAAGIVLFGLGGKGRIASLLCLALLSWIPQTGSGAARVTFLSVGQGDAIVIESRNPRRVAVIDGGSAFNDWDAGRYVVAPYLKSRGIRTIDILIASHPDVDHVGGMETLAEEFDIGLFVRGEWRPGDTETAFRLEKRLNDAGIISIIPQAGDSFILGRGSRIDVLAGTDNAGLSSNDRSLVLRLQLNKVSVLLCGDLEISGEHRLDRFWHLLQSDILKFPHHGSEDVMSDRLLENIQPSMAVISVGSGNSYGHPSPNQLERLRRLGIDVWRTDRYGALVVNAGD